MTNRAVAVKESDYRPIVGASPAVIDLLQTERGILLPVTAQAGAKNNGITGQHDGALKVSVTQVPEKGKANKALANVIAAEPGLKRSQVEFASGATSTSKLFVIIGVELTDLNSRLQNRLQS